MALLQAADLKIDGVQRTVILRPWSSCGWGSDGRPRDRPPPTPYATRSAFPKPTHHANRAGGSYALN